MYKMKSEMTTQMRENVRGGVGDLPFLHVFTPEDLDGRATMFATITLQPGESIGEHSHDVNGEAYFVLTGSATVTDDGESRILNVGDAEFCANGHKHSIVNHTDKEMSILAVIIPDERAK